MRVFLLLITISIAACFPEWVSVQMQETLRTWEIECMAELSIDEDTFENAKKKGLDSIASDIKCMPSCMFRKVGLLSTDGVFKEDTLHALNLKLSDEMIIEMSEKCKKEVVADVCETGMRLLLCFAKYRAVL